MSVLEGNKRMSVPNQVPFKARAYLVRNNIVLKTTVAVLRNIQPSSDVRVYLAHTGVVMSQRNCLIRPDWPLFGAS